MILRIIDKKTKLFLRDDFTFDNETEIGLNVEPSQGLIQPKWVEQEITNEHGQIISQGHWIEAEVGE